MATTLESGVESLKGIKGKRCLTYTKGHFQWSTGVTLVSIYLTLRPFLRSGFLLNTIESKI